MKTSYIVEVKHCPEKIYMEKLLAMIRHGCDSNEYLDAENKWWKTKKIRTFTVNALNTKDAANVTARELKKLGAVHVTPDEDKYSNYLLLDGEAYYECRIKTNGNSCAVYCFSE